MIRPDSWPSPLPISPPPYSRLTVPIPCHALAFQPHPVDQIAYLIHRPSPDCYATAIRNDQLSTFCVEHRRTRLAEDEADEWQKHS